MKLSRANMVILLIAFLFGCNSYENDGNSVYYNSWNEGTGSHKEQLVGVNPKKFQILKYDQYAKDDKLVFYKGELIKNADAPSFEALGEYYAHDSYRGYYGGDSIKSSHGKNFKVINAYYTTDGVDVFFMNSPLHIESAKSFRFVYATGEDGSERWTTDGKFYYIESFKVPSSDYKNIIVYKNSGGISKDSHWAYYLDRKLNYNDSGRRIVDTIDIASFKVTGFLECRDNFSCFNVYHGREKCEPNNK